MSRFGKTLFSGSRFIFWSLAPLLILCIVVLPFLPGEWTVSSFFFLVVTEAILVTLVLGLFNPQRFRWATRCVTGIVFCFYLAYVVDEVFLSGKGLGSGSGSRAETSPRNAISGFIAIGLPCLWYTLFGRFSPKAKNESHGSGPKLPDDVETTNFDL